MSKTIAAEVIATKIRELRGKRVMLERDLAKRGVLNSDRAIIGFRIYSDPKK